MRGFICVVLFFSLFPLMNACDAPSLSPEDEAMIEESARMLESAYEQSMRDEQAIRAEYAKCFAFDGEAFVECMRVTEWRLHNGIR